MARKPVIALMGEFSAGKSTLANLLLGEVRSPVQVTATQLPPVWYAYGSGSPFTVGLDGAKRPLDLNELDRVTVADTAFVRIPIEADILTICEMIDMPGNSDPNMSPEVWQRTIHFADSVIWCTHATQAWRQSEAAVWDEFPAEVHARSLLLLTRFDKILKDTDKARVINRVTKEAGDKFRAIFPVSLLTALEAGEEDRERWEQSGAEAFTQALLDIVLELEAEKAGLKPAPSAATHADAGKVVSLDAPQAARPTTPEARPASDGPVTPRRVSRPSAKPSARPRPGRDGGARPGA
ncbi:MAG: hypothetical protein AAFR35_03790 [Pseudomonadota bacterium]